MLEGELLTLSTKDWQPVQVKQFEVSAFPWVSAAGG
jgi:hypothetical protein